MKGSSRLAGLAAQASRALGALAVLAGAVTPVHAQPPQRGPGENAFYLLVVPAFTSSDKQLGCSAANEVRDRLDGDADTKKLWIIPQHSIEETLKASGFPPCTPISATDDKQLAQQLRGEAYLDGTVTKTATGVRLEPKLVLARDASAAQPLPPAEAPKVGDAAKVVSKEVQAALKQLDGEQKCYNAARSGQYQNAIAAAQTAIAAYPQASLARLCIANALVAMKAPPDSVIAITQEILKDDPHNHRALEIASQAYYDKKDYDNAVKAWGQLIASDPSNTALVEDVVTKIVQSGHSDAAIPIVAQAVKDNPDDAKLVDLQCRLDNASKNYKDAVTACEAAAKGDTAFADTTFFQKLTTAYLADSQPQKAVEAAGRGLTKFPTNTTLTQLKAQAEISAGQTQAAVADLQKLLQANPKNPQAWMQLVAAYLSMNQIDSAIAAGHGAVANGDSSTKADIAKFFLPMANTYFKKGQQSKNMDTLAVALKLAKYADSLSSSPASAFIAGASEFSIGLDAEQNGAKAKNCDQVKKALDMWNNANLDLHKGGSISPAAAGQMLQAVTQYTPAIEKQVKIFCK